MRNLVWFRRDLRINDNRALARAVETQDDGVIGVFVMTPQQWKEHDDAACKVSFWLGCLAELSQSLAKLNIPLLIVKCKDFSGVPKAIAKAAKSHDCGSLFFNREYEVNELRRDQAVAEVCEQQGLSVERFHDRIIVPPRDISTKEGKFYSVFTPYRKVWDGLAEEHLVVAATPKKQKPIDVEASPVPESVSGYKFSSSVDERWPPGEKEARRRLKEYSKLIDNYSEGRDLPAIDGTSQLSPYLAAGAISPRACAALAIKANDGQIGDLKKPANEGARVWLSELTWRDFYTHVLVGFPRVSMHRPFKLKTEALKWRDDEEDFEAWKNGQTGYPIVDAGMRQLKETGWMHNRLRMVTAMFLTKHLLIDWRMGERYFMENLIDGDLAANNGGWQWSASTGTDSVPYFRIFSPFSQSKRFDTEGEFIKRMCPELAEVPAKALHDEKKLRKAVKEFDSDYVDYVVDYSKGRARALAAFKKL